MLWRMELHFGPQMSNGLAEYETPEHPVRGIIRETLGDLAKRLKGFEQTTHGAIATGHIESLGYALIACYRDPRAFTISDLSQHAEAICNQQRPS